MCVYVRTRVGALIVCRPSSVPRRKGTVEYVHLFCIRTLQRTIESIDVLAGFYLGSSKALDALSLCVYTYG
jgi:hypothetical protein